MREEKENLDRWKGERVVQRRTVIGDWCHSLSPLWSSLTHLAKPLYVFHQPVCASALSPVNNSLAAPLWFDWRQKWLASRPCRYTIQLIHVPLLVSTSAERRTDGPFWTSWASRSLLSDRQLTSEVWKYTNSSLLDVISVHTHFLTTIIFFLSYIQKVNAFRHVPSCSWADTPWTLGFLSRVLSSEFVLVICNSER